MSPQTCRQESPTCIVIIICTLVPGVSRKGSTACPPIAIRFNPVTGDSPLHFVCAFHLLCNYKHSLLSFIILWAHLSPSSYSCGFHTLFSSIIHEQTRCHTHKHMQFLCWYTASTTQVSGIDRMFVSKTSFGDHNGNKVTFSSK